MTPDPWRTLASLPLLGSGRARAEEICAELSAHPDRETARRLQGWSGLLLFAAGKAGAVERLTAAARTAAAAGEADEALRLRLWLVRALAAERRVALGSALLDEIGAAAETSPELRADLHLARAATGHANARHHWQEALKSLPSPVRDLDRFEAHLCLGLLARDGGDVPRARTHWREALALAERHEDSRGRLRLAALLGNLLVEAGLLPEAETHLKTAVEAAWKLNDPLTVVAEGTVLAALQLGREDWAAAEATGVLLAEAASRRNNWIGMADAAITRSSARLGLGDIEGAVGLLWEAALLLRDLGAAAALNLIRARLGELRGVLGAELFDRVLGRITEIDTAANATA